MNLILITLGAGILALLTMSIAIHEFISAGVLIAACLTFFALWKWQKFLPAESWGQSRFKYGRVLRLAIGIGIFILAMLQIGIVARTIWAGKGAIENGDIFFAVIMAVFALALAGYEKLAAILFMEFFFSMTLAGAVIRVAVDDHEDSGAERRCAYALAFLIVFVLGQGFHWSKGFGLAGLIAIFLIGLGSYLTM